MQNFFNSQLEKYGIDGMYIINPINIRYVTGFTGSFGVVIVIKNQTILVTDSRYFEEAKKQCQGITVINVQDKTWEEIIHKCKRIAFGAEFMTVQRFQQLERKFYKTQWIPSLNTMEQMRRVKNAFEITALSKACEITEICLTKVLETIKEDDKEIDIARRLEIMALQEGAEGVSFPPIVAFEENSAIPHHHPGLKQLKRGNTILIDFGVKYHGYCSDLTRTFFFQEVSKEKEKIYNIVLEAQKIGMKEMQAGAFCSDPFLKVVEFFKEQELDRFFTHSLGHGIGLEIHELPYIKKESADRLVEWDTITCEPGIYLPGKFGVRIEDSGIVKKNGYETLTKFPKELIVLK